MCVKFLDCNLAENKQLQPALDKSITVLAEVLKFDQLYNLIVAITLTELSYFL